MNYRYRCPWCQERLRYLFVAKLGSDSTPCPHCKNPIKAAAKTIRVRILIMITAPIVLFLFNPHLDQSTVIFIMLICVAVLYLLPIAANPIKDDR